jgi:putative SOS response-associated peptidase YedK
MCGRARLATDYSELKIQLDLEDFGLAPNLRPSWNIAPTQDMLTVLRDPERAARVARPMYWGLIPSWSKELKMKYATFNAKSETVATMASFRSAWKAGRRCLIVTDGFYEWRKSDKQPFTIQRKDGKLTIMAGLWETWRSPANEVVNSCTILTTEPNEAMASVHNRMPVILAASDWPVWLGEMPANDDAVTALLRPCPSADLTMWEVGKRVGNVRNNDKSLVVEYSEKGN